ncbi:MAG: hypothetical protein IKN81_02470 [Oscillospiraceae bacterium]|nr:hypothetical protein [Oscillospiraceae bacterium]
MPMSSGRKAVTIILSILIAFVVWFYVNSTADVDLAINDIPVEFLNAETALANKGLMLISGSDATVDLVLTLPRDTVYGFDTEHVRLIADLSSINTTGTQSLTYSIAYPPGVNPNLVSVKSPTVRTVSVRVGELYRKNDVEIRVNLVGNVADGYVAGRVQLLPGVLEVWGQQSDVTKVSYAVVTLNIENARSTIVEQLEYTLYDYEDLPIESDSIHAASDTIQVTMPVISATDIPLTVHFTEEPGVRLESFDYTLDVPAVTLSGDANQIAALSEIVLGEVALAEIEETETFTFEIPIPEGMTNLSGVTEATLTVTNRDVATRAIVVNNFEYENFNVEDRTVEVVTGSLAVTLRGARSVLDSISSQDVTAVADLSGVTNASGTYTVPAEIRVANDLDVGTVQAHQLTVRIGLPETETETEEENDTDRDG